MRLLHSLSLIPLAISMSAYADTYQFAFTGVTWNYQGVVENDNFNFQIATSDLRGADQLASGGFSYALIVPATVNDLSAPFDVFLVEEPGSGVIANRLAVQSVGSTNTSGGYIRLGYVSYDLFLTGDLSDPIIQQGTFQLGGGNVPLGDPAQGTLTVTDLTPISVTPEPSSLLLLSTGLLGIAEVRRKHFA